MKTGKRKIKLWPYPIKSQKVVSEYVIIIFNFKGYVQLLYLTEWVTFHTQIQNISFLKCVKFNDSVVTDHQ